MNEETIGTLAKITHADRLSEFRKRFATTSEGLQYLNALETELSAPQTGMPVNVLTIIERIRGLEIAVQARDAALAEKAAQSSAAQLPKADGDILRQYQAIQHSQDRQLFYRRNKEAIDRAHRDSEPAPHVPKATGNAIVDKLNSISDPRARTKFYRDNKAAIDASFKK